MHKGILNQSVFRNFLIVKPFFYRIFVFVIVHSVQFSTLCFRPDRKKGGIFSMLQLTDTNRAIMEDLSYPDPMFPVMEFVDHFDSFADKTFPSHWHPELEIQLILHGCAEYSVNGASYVVREGCGIYIAPETVHMMKALSTGTVGYNLVLLPQFLENCLRSARREKYIQPFTSRGADACLITPEHKEGHVILDTMHQLYRTENTHFAYELFQLEKIISIWRNLLSILPDQGRLDDDSGKNLRIQRMRAMLGFIRANYAQPITVDDIAASANIAKSECFRCFAELSKTTPVEYVAKIRLMHAAQLLVTTDSSISGICFATGFNNTSYFSKRFSREYGMTPKAYRTKNRCS